MQIGLIGGIGPAATDYYYKRLIRTFSNAGLSLDLTMVHADTKTLLANLANNDVASQVAIYMRLTERLAAAGAGCVVITSIAGHFCIDAFAAVSPLPVINLISEVNRSVKAAGYRRVGIVGTRTVMETQIYGGISTASVIPPSPSDLEAVHQAYVDMAAAGVVTNEQIAIFDAASARLMQEAGAEAMLLGGTDLALVYNETETRFPVIDCAAIHVDAIVRFVTT